MMEVHVNLNIHGHCIETEAKNEFKRLMDKYFSSDEDSCRLEKEIDLLREFLETSDFAHLRSSDKRLSGEISSTVIIERNSKGSIDIIFE